jgi:hypothetical protein
MPEFKPSLQERIDAYKAQVEDIETSMIQLFQDLKYPVDATNNVLDMNHLPDVPTTLSYHLIRLGWRKDQSKALIKARKITGGGYYEDLVAWVGINEDDDPIVTNAEPVPDAWSVTPTVNVIDEERPE